MPRPGVDVSLLDTPGSVVSIPTDTGTWFVAGLTDMGPLTAQQVLSLDDFVTKFGARQAYSVLYDSVQTFFREGGDKMYVARVVGPGATSGTHNLLDGAAAIALTATAIGPGAWSANYKVVVAAGGGSGTFVIRVTDTPGNILEDSGDLIDNDAAVQWSQTSKYIRLSLGASALDPAVAAGAALSAGTDDRTNITDTQWLSALNTFTSDLGPGQVSSPGRTSTNGHTQLVDHAEDHNRVALLDLTDSGTSSTLISNIAASRFAAAFAPWIKIPGLVAGSFRTVPPSALIAGLVARNDPVYGSNHASAGRFGLSRYAVGLSQSDWDDATRATLNAAGVDVIRILYGTVTVYGWRSTVNANTDPNWIDFGNARQYTKLSAELNQVGQNYVFEDIDGQDGRTIGGFHDVLAGVLMEHYNSRQLFGSTPDEAFSVDTGPSVNTLTNIANLELNAVCYVKMSPFAEHVAIQIVKRSVTEV